MKKKVFAMLSLLLMLTLVLLPYAPAARAEENVTLNFDVKFGQTEARSMLAMINSFRTDTSGGAWQWNADDATKTVYNVDGGTTLSPLTYDYDLEAAAMQRAAELILYFAHERPNGTPYYTAFSPVYSGYIGENAAMGQRSASAVFTAWQENNDGYSGQGHRRNMLSPDYTSIGIGHAIYNGTHYWTQAFSNRVGNATATGAVDVTVLVTIVSDASRVTFVESYASPAGYALELGGSADLPEAIIKYTLASNSSLVIESKENAAWASGDTSVATVGAGKVSAGTVGSTKLTATAGGRNFEAAVDVTPMSIAGAKVTPEYTEAEYTGKEFKPAVTVELGGKSLTEGTDYTVAYSDNKAVGTAKITVTGIGNYKDTAAASFTVRECEHELGEGKVTKEASCSEEGETTYECSKCDYVKTEKIEKKAHTPGDAATCDKAQVCSVCGVELAPATGEHIDEDGDKKCDVCALDLSAPTTTTTTTTTTTAKPTTTTTKRQDGTNGNPNMNDPVTPLATRVMFAVMCISAIAMAALLRDPKRANR